MRLYSFRLLTSFYGFPATTSAVTSRRSWTGQTLRRGRGWGALSQLELELGRPTQHFFNTCVCFNAVEIMNDRPHLLAREDSITPLIVFLDASRCGSDRPKFGSVPVPAEIWART